MRKPNIVLIALALAMLQVGTSRAGAQQSEDDKFLLHGFMTQAYAKSDKLPLLGIPKEGTWNYRLLGLHMRYDLAANNQVVVQLRHRQIGDRLINDDEVALEWAYYAHRFGTVTAKVGKAPLPLGLYNEIRNVGTLLPFFRAPPSLYFEGPEQFEGASVSKLTPIGGWEVESTVWAGGVTIPLQFNTPGGPILATARSRNSYGAQLWFQTPIQQVRIGTTLLAFQYPVSGAGPDTTRVHIYNTSLGALFDRVQLRSEYMRYTVRDIFAAGGDWNIAAYYVQGSVKLVDRLSLHAQFENSDNTDAGDKYTWMREHVLGIGYHVAPNVVLKLEGHKAKGYNLDQYRPRPTPPGETYYGIASLSASF